MTEFEMPVDNFIDKTVNFFSPAAGLRRKESRMKSSFLNTITPLKQGRDSQRPHSPKGQRGEDIISANDRKFQHSLIRVLSKENPLLKGTIDRMVNNIVPHGGILPAPTTDDDQFNKDAESYYMEDAERCEITNRFSMSQYQGILLNRTLSDGDFLSVFTNWHKLQGIEAERIISPRCYSKEEGTTLHQGIRVNRYGAPTVYYVGSRDRYGNIVDKDHRGIQARNCHHSFITDRMEEYRGTSVFLPVLDHFRDIQDIIQYEKFIMKMASCIGLKISPAKNDTGTQLPFPVQDTKTKGDGKVQKVNSMFPGMILDLPAMGRGDAEILESNRPGDNFENMMTLIARIAGVGIGLPIELVLLDYHRGNMASVRAALMEARKTFLSHYGIVKRFAQHHYRWKISHGVKIGKLTPPAKIRNNYWSCEWSEPVWNWLDPLNEIEAEGLQIAYGFKTYEEVAKQRGKDWAQIAVQLGKEQARFQEEEAKIIIGQPGATVLGDEGLTEKATSRNTTKAKPTKKEDK